MADNLTKKQRQYCMSRIKSTGTTPETTVRKMIWSRGYRYRIGHKLKGRPDIVFPSYGIAVFIDGCFWHGCSKHCRMPLSNTQYWKQKIADNKKRDKKNSRQLKKAGWMVIRVWEHSVKKDLQKVVEKIINHLN